MTVSLPRFCLFHLSMPPLPRDCCLSAGARERLLQGLRKARTLFCFCRPSGFDFLQFRSFMANRLRALVFFQYLFLDGYFQPSRFPALQGSAHETGKIVR